MQFTDIALQDAFFIEMKPMADDRGSFCRLFCQEKLQEKGIAERDFAQINLSLNNKRGTLRGLHYQAPPYLEAKIVYCLQGAVYDVMVDLRKESPTYKRHFGCTLSGAKPLALYIPKGFAHGFLTLEDDSRLLYLMSDCYKPGFDRGCPYNDPAFDISWPFEPVLISERDQNHPFWKEEF